MSYFMTLVGKPPELPGIEPIEFVPYEEAQVYIRDHAQELIKMDGEPLFLVHDGETSTSHNFIVDAENDFTKNSSLSGTKFFKLLEGFIAAGNKFRIWWASGVPFTKIIQGMQECSSLPEVLSSVQHQVNQNKDISICYKPAKKTAF